MSADTATSLIDHAAAILLDFDGPVCSVFAGYRAHDVAAAVSAVAISRSIHLTPHNPDDPISIFRATAGCNADVISAVQDALAYEEHEALSRTVPTPGAKEVILDLRRRGRAVAIVTNNGAEPVAAFLVRHNLQQCIDVVIGRDPLRPEDLKPSPVLVKRALAALRIDPKDAVFVGDSITDVQAGQAAGVAVIGYANKSGKSERLALAGAYAVVTDMSSLLAPRDRIIP